ncbi:50S ribosomal protein L18e [Archaeoglobus veneficus]|uniref:Large ribosomal subunit protein eL18 n=1 Tax=Archaeoglobus veneficus (strain DSM 11195 / SNP6) TaxID=693661 RepID=F2KPR2_ARCVS|nr:50S ribosomal protein L18e [Archaeoglobus veneficus]AEA47590.1 ribosomal protein L15 [Archaeoglobus veneficus SNP6]
MSRLRKLQRRKSNPNLVKLIDELLAKDKRVWKDLAERLAKPRRRYAEVNLSKLEKYVSDDEIALVPGKVLGSGEVTKPIKVAALGFSAVAKRKIEEAGGVCMSISEAMQAEGKFRIIG